MITELKSHNLFYRKLTSDDVTETYVSWLNDTEINRFLETRHKKQDFKSCMDFVISAENDPCQHLFGIFLTQNQNHIGNIKLGFINCQHNRGQLSLFIGEKKYWGKGYATEAIKTITRWGFESLGLSRIEAGCSEENIASKNAFMKAGYTVEGYFREHELVDGKRTGSYWFGILPNEIS